jgi:hypothetical protein
MISTATHPTIELRLQELRAAASHASPEAAARVLAAVHTELGRSIETVKSGLLATTLDWMEEQKAQARWIYESSSRAAALSLQIAESLRRQAGTDDARTLDAIALALYYTGESMKWEIVTAAQVPRDYRALHSLMTQLIAAGRQRSPMRLDIGGRERTCTLESLYFRALLLARYASGILSCAQIEILDEWLWIWAPLLQGVSAPPAGSALRADLDSPNGLRRGPRDGEGPALYLPQAPIDAAFQTLVEQFQSGRIVPEEGCTAAFRIEEHVAVLDIVRRALRTSMDEPVPRASRRHVNLAVEVHLGLTQIEQRGFELGAPAVPGIALATVDGMLHATNTKRERESALGGIYDKARCIVNLDNVSDSGLGLEGSNAQCEAMVVGSLIGLRPTPGGPLVIGTITRNIVAAGHGRVVVGVRQISSEAKMVGITVGTGSDARVVPMLWIQGGDDSGSRDGYLVSERTFDQGLTYEVCAGQNTYSFRFNRVRERGRGWILAGFEVLAARPAGTNIAAQH